MRAPRALSLILGTALLLTACGSGDLPPHEVQASEEEIPEGMEDWAYLLGHTTPFESATEWDGDLDGFKTEWFDSGSKSGEGEYRESKRVGPWTFWHKNGHKRWEGNYVADVPVGMERAWYDDGTPHFEGSFEDGLRQGAFTYWFTSGQLWWKGTFEKGKRDGVYARWNSDGSIDKDESGIYERGVKTAELELGDQALLASDPR
jgi:antitoxin component YwqK of YwqJK toxin-antitoxin module